ncbi:SDR family oxidoreductase [Glutamicibacter halophytocola]|uniref:SDR family oxidoreductase n=1 Tax=Glutamicibacter halophytocola TaxID=1933880 RepID=UPI003219DF72
MAGPARRGTRDQDGDRRLRRPRNPGRRTGSVRRYHRNPQLRRNLPIRHERARSPRRQRRHRREADGFCRSRLPELRRIVHISGYRVGGQDPSLAGWSQERRDQLYRTLGAYEASKVESDAVFQALGNERGIPWSIVNPASVIGHSITGETDQHIGLASTVEQLWEGKTGCPARRRLDFPAGAHRRLHGRVHAGRGYRAGGNRHILLAVG